MILFRNDETNIEKKYFNYSSTTLYSHKISLSKNINLFDQPHNKINNFNENNKTKNKTKPHIARKKTFKIKDFFQRITKKNVQLQK